MSNEPSSAVLELSVAETNRLRASLGLAPLRGVSGILAEASPAAADTTTHASSKEELVLSVEATNVLRSQLGLAPLRDTANEVTPTTQHSSRLRHAPAENQGDRQQAAERIEQARLRRQVEQNVAQLYGEASLAENATINAQSWAQSFRARPTAEPAARQPPSTESSSSTAPAAYTAQDLRGLRVAHAVQDFQDNATTVLTLTDSSLLTRDEASGKVLGLTHDQDASALENVDLATARIQKDGLREKRKVEMGMGRAGGYAGYDDDEFEELGGTQGPSRAGRRPHLERGEENARPSEIAKSNRGFSIGAVLDEYDRKEVASSDLFASKHQAISLEPTRADVTASDFMTAEEERVLRAAKKESTKFKKKKKKSKTKTSRTTNTDDGDESEKNRESSLLDELEETAVEGSSGALQSRKRRRRQHDDTEENEDKALKVKPDKPPSMHVDNSSHDAPSAAEKRAKYDAIMAKGNERTKAAFAVPKTKTVDLDDEPDDAFLNAALAKARRLNRLKEMTSKAETVLSHKGANAVLQALQSSNKPADSSLTTGSTNTISFSVDDTREFTRALRARDEQVERELSKRYVKSEREQVVKQGTTVQQPTVSTVDGDQDAMDTGDVDMHELAKEVKEDHVTALEGTTGTDVPVGRGLAGMLNILKQNGDMTRKNAGKEELRGRAKDERNYEDYEPLDLKKVVKIDGRKANDKDKEFAKREVKLEYRDKHGRLLTRKEAFRDLSYQFHGYTSGKRKEEKKLQQIAREQAEVAVAARQAGEGGTLGALRATQKATGKAFVVHKT
jgi:U4/U6.U5 tri-snRNP-associated protein 1